MNFGEAIEAAQRGMRIARAGWNGKGMFVAFMSPQFIPARYVSPRTRAFVDDEMLRSPAAIEASGDEAGGLFVGGYFAMWTAQGVLQPGWLASQADMLAEDWVVLEDTRGTLPGVSPTLGS